MHSCLTMRKDERLSRSSTISIALFNKKIKINKCPLFTLGKWLISKVHASGAKHANFRNKYFKLNITGLKIPTGRRQASWLFTSVAKELAELGSVVKQLQVVVRAGLEPGNSGFQVRCPNHSATVWLRGYNKNNGLRSHLCWLCAFPFNCIE